MDTIVFRIMMHGLIALAPSPDSNDPNHITALLLDVRTPHEHEHECMGAHHPKLSFLLAKTPDNAGKCFAAGCEQTGNECVCTDSLSKKKIWLQINPRSIISSPEGSQAAASAEVGEDHDNNYGIPSDGRAPVGSMHYVANMTKPPFNAKLNLDYLAPKPQATNLFARMEVPFSTLTACALSTREDQGKDHVVPMSLRPLRAQGKENDRSQAFAQMVMAKFDIEEGQEVELHLSDFSGDNEHSFLLAPGDRGYMIMLSNEADSLERGSACDDGIARHFAHFYEFAENRPAWGDRRIPHVRFIKGMKAEGVDPEECKDPTFNFITRPICPMASFLEEGSL